MQQPHRLFDYLVGAGEQRRWDFQPEYFSGFKVDDQLELGRLLDRQIGRLGPPQNLVNVIRSAPV